jgi:hypothetical protein
MAENGRDHPYMDEEGRRGVRLRRFLTFIGMLEDPDTGRLHRGRAALLYLALIAVLVVVIYPIVRALL